MVERLKKILPVLILALFGLGISIVAQVVHLRLVTDPSYTSFCNISSGLNCDTVMGSRYAQLAGIPVSLWAIGYYLVVIGVLAGLAAVDRARQREKLAAVTLLLAGWGLVFSTYMAVMAFGVLHAVCALCTGLYLVNIAVFAAAWHLRSRVRFIGRQLAAGRARQDRVVLIGGVGAAVAVLAIGSWEAFGRGAGPSDITAIARGGRWRGDVHAPVTVVEFSDFQCSHCANFHRSLDTVFRRLGQDIRIVFRHFPLDARCNPKVTVPLHREACEAAVGAECAGEQDKFWPYHDLLFDNQQHLGRESLIAFATQLGLNIPQFTVCLDGPEALARVKADIKMAIALGIDSTPTVFINGRMIKGTLEPDALSDAVTVALAAPTPR